MDFVISRITDERIIKCLAVVGGASYEAGVPCPDLIGSPANWKEQVMLGRVQP